MISKIQLYSQKSNSTFGASIPKNKLVIEYLGENNVLVNKSIPKETIFTRLKNVFFELFPKLDPEYRNFMKKSKI
jgi:hypothetical protein